MKFFSNLLKFVSRFLFSTISQSNAIVANIENWAQTPQGQAEISWAEKIASGIVGPATVKAIEAFGLKLFEIVGLIDTVEGKLPGQVLDEVAANLKEIKAASGSAFTLVTTDLSKEIHKVILGEQGATTEVPNHALLIESVYRTEKQLVKTVSADEPGVSSGAVGPEKAASIIPVSIVPSETLLTLPEVKKSDLLT